MKESGPKAFAKRAALRVISVLFRKNRIVFESNPEFACNTYPVYRYLIDEKHIDGKYEIVWLVKDPEKYADCTLPNHSFIEYSKADDPLKKKIEYLWTIATARALVYSNRLLGKYSKSQYSICLMHGMPLKRTQDIYRIDDLCDNVVCMSDFFEDDLAEGFGITKNKLLPMDFARNDYLFSDRDVSSVLKCSQYEKVFVWLPTYRKNRFQQQYDIEENATGLPLLRSEEDLKRVNDWLSGNQCLLIIKPHPIHAKQLKELKMSNIRVMTDSMLAKNGVQTNELLGASDAMITDYSTVYYDYLLTGKPIGLTTDDVEEYIAKRGFFYDDVYSVLKGVHIDAADGLLRFFEDVKNGIDDKKTEREEMKLLLHPYYRENMSAVLGDLILEKISETIS